MFDKNFFPTPPEVIAEMCEGEELRNKTILEPSAGKGNIVDFCFGSGAAAVIACESHEDLRKILTSKCQVIANDFLQLESHAISHIDYIIMNPPFDTADKHITHAYNIAPPGCKIIALCNSATLENTYTGTRKELRQIIAAYGESRSIGNVFATAERKTDVDTSLIKILKPGSNYNTEFEGFFTDEEPEELGENGIMSYNVVRDLVNRYVGAVKIFDEQMETAVKLNNLTTGYFDDNTPGLSITVNSLSVPLKRNEFKKAMQKSGWLFIFEKLNMKKYSTQGLKEDINKFVEKQTEFPFTMKNIYKMLEVVVGTQGSRMDKALEEVFDKLTKHSHENRFNLPGWQTNSHYLVNPRFIMPYMCNHSTGSKIALSYCETTTRNFEVVEDFVKALCYITGDNYDKFNDLRHRIEYPVLAKIKSTGEYIKSTYSDSPQNYKSIKDFHDEGWRRTYDKPELKGVEIIPEDRGECLYGEWFEWAYFKIKAFKKGTFHFEFLDNELWAKFNIEIARIKNYPLFEGKEQTKWQQQQAKKQRA